MIFYLAKLILPLSLEAKSTVFIFINQKKVNRNIPYTRQEFVFHEILYIQCVIHISKNFLINLTFGISFNKFKTQQQFSFKFIF